jgi:hypothetical protein
VASGERGRRRGGPAPGLDLDAYQELILHAERASDAEERQLGLTIAAEDLEVDLDAADAA